MRKWPDENVRCGDFNGRGALTGAGDIIALGALMARGGAHGVRAAHRSRALTRISCTSTIVSALHRRASVPDIFRRVAPSKGASETSNNPSRAGLTADRPQVEEPDPLADEIGMLMSAGLRSQFNAN
jgi:hypothetical protein